MKRRSRSSIRIKHCLIIYCCTTIPFSCVLCIIFCRKTRCPSRTKLFPLRLICCRLLVICLSSQTGCITNRKPCWLPIIYTKSTDLVYCSNQITNCRCLSLLIKRLCNKSSSIIITNTNCIIMSIRII